MTGLLLCACHLVVGHRGCFVVGCVLTVVESCSKIAMFSTHNDDGCADALLDEAAVVIHLPPAINCLCCFFTGLRCL